MPHNLDLSCHKCTNLANKFRITITIQIVNLIEFFYRNEQAIMNCL